jgi:hypothetical protein
MLHRPDDELLTREYDYPALIRDYDPVDPWMEYAKLFIQQDLFTPEEATAIASYFAKRQPRGVILHRDRQPFPISRDHAPCNAAGYSTWDGEYLFDQEEGFDCPVRFWGYYWLGDTQAVAVQIHARCEITGRIKLTGQGGYQLLPSEAVVALFEAWKRARSTGQEESLILRGELLPDAEPPWSSVQGSEPRTLFRQDVAYTPDPLPPPA